MPSIELLVDNRCFRIDSADLEMCGKWFADCITMYPINPATRLQLRVMPFFVPIPEDQRGRHNAWHGEAPAHLQGRNRLPGFRPVRDPRH